jgi:hypothetical protein
VQVDYGCRRDTCNRDRVLTAVARADVSVVGRADEDRTFRAVGGVDGGAMVGTVALEARDRGARRLHGGGGSWACGDPRGVIFSRRGLGRVTRG